MRHDTTLRTTAEEAPFLEEPPTLELSVVIVSHNVRELLRQCLHSVYAALGDMAAEVIVVDNASEDGTVERLREEFQQVCWVPLPVNVGFGRANNCGIARARGRYILLLNPDTLVHPETLRAVYAYMEEHPEVGIAGCRVLNADGTFQSACRRGFPTPWAAFTRLFGLERLFPRSPLFARYSQGFRPEREVGYAEVISGAFMFCRREVLRELRGFDPEYFLYGEDVDLCYRAHRAGWRIGYVGTATILHFKGASTRRSRVDAVHHFYDAMRIFVRRYYGRSPLALLLYAGIALRKLVARAAQFPQLWLLGIADLVGVSAALLLATRVRFGEFFGFPGYAYPTVFIVLGGVLFGLMLLVGDYLERRVQISRALMVYGLCFFVVSSLTYFFKDYAFSRWVVLGTVVGGALWAVVVRSVLQIRSWFRQGIRPRRVAILGTGAKAREVAAALLDGREAATRLVVLGVIRAPGHDGELGLELPVLGRYEELPDLVARWEIQELVVVSGGIPLGELVGLMERLARWRVRLYVVDGAEELSAQRFVYELLGHEPSWIAYPLLHPRLRLAKRLFDLGVALCALTFGAPLVFLSAQRRTLWKRWWNVLRGRWSVVGISVVPGESPEGGKPGVIGLVELSGGVNLPAAVVRQLNQYYVRHFSLALDVEIVLKYCIWRLRGAARSGL